MVKVLKGWVERYLSDPEAILILVLLLGSYFILKYFGSMLAPVFISIAIAWMLQFWVNLLEKNNCPHELAIWGVYLAFIAVFMTAILVLLPLLWRQFMNLFMEMPALLQNGQKAASDFVHNKNVYISQDNLDAIFSNVLTEAQEWGKHAIAASLATISGVLTWIIYLILVPLLVFFFLRDHRRIVKWFKQFLPEKRGLIRKIWYEMHAQVGNYVKGKLTEIVIVGVVTYISFAFFGLRYQALLAFLVGLSVVIPYVGIVLVTIPVLLVGYFQWGFVGGWTGEFALMTYTYTFIQLVDGGILVPLLFSEAVNLHPIAVILAILFFGTLWGFWGVFFAIPLATLVKAIINAWPRQYSLRKA